MRRLIRGVLRLAALATLAWIVYRLISDEEADLELAGAPGTAPPAGPPGAEPERRPAPTPRRTGAGTKPGGPSRPPAAKPQQPDREHSGDGHWGGGTETAVRPEPAEPPGEAPVREDEPADAAEQAAGEAAGIAETPATDEPAPGTGMPGVRSIGVGEVPEHVPKWVEPDAGGGCPVSHPVKANLTSGIFHVPEGAHYERTNADRCYRDPESAQADGLRQSKQ